MDAVRCSAYVCTNYVGSGTAESVQMLSYVYLNLFIKFTTKYSMASLTYESCYVSSFSFFGRE